MTEVKKTSSGKSAGLKGFLSSVPGTASCLHSSSRAAIPHLRNIFSDTQERTAFPLSEKEFCMAFLQRTIYEDHYYKQMPEAHLTKMPSDNARTHSFGSEPFLRPANKDTGERLAAARDQQQQRIGVSLPTALLNRKIIFPRRGEGGYRRPTEANSDCSRSPIRLFPSRGSRILAGPRQLVTASRPRSGSVVLSRDTRPHRGALSLK